MTFVECDTCRAKPGAPELCQGCRINRATIEGALTVQQRIADQFTAARDANERLLKDVAAWRINYRHLMQTLNEENNYLRSTCASLSAKLTAKQAPRSLLEFFTRPKD